MKRILLCALVAFPALLLSSCNKEMEENVAGLTAKQQEMAEVLDELKATDSTLDALIDALEARVASLEGKVTGLETSVGGLETDIDGIETNIGNIETDVDNIETDIDGIETDITTLQSEIAALNTALQSLKAMDSKVNSTVQELQNAMMENDGKFNEVYNRLSEIEKITGEFEALKGQLEEIGVLKTDVESLKQSLTEMVAANADLNGLISALEARADQLETEIEALKNAGTDVPSGGDAPSDGGDTPSGGTDTQPDNSQVEALEVRVAALENELTATESAITTLDGTISDIQGTIREIASAMLTYASATDLEALEGEVNTLKTTVASLTSDYTEKFGLIETEIDNIQQTLQNLADADQTLEGLITALQGKASEIEESIELLEQSVTDNVNQLNAKIATLNTDLTAVNAAIAELKEKDKATDAAITSLQGALAAHETAVQTTLEGYLSDVQGISDEFTAQLNEHISASQTAFAQNTDAISALTGEIAAMKDQYEARFDLIESEIGGIVAMIQSMTPISEWSNGDASARYYTDWANEKNNLATVEFNYIVRPAGAAARLAQAWAENKDLMQFRAHYTITRASFDFVDMDVMDVSASGDILTVTGYVDGISEEWIKDQESFSVSLLVTDGKTDYCTPFVNIRGDLQGTDLSADETANCYMVHEPGYYRFKIHRTIDSHSAEVLWESLGTAETPEVGCLVEPELEIRNNFVYFKTNDTWKDGNALIAVKNAAGEVVWSWHIWMTGDLPQERTYNNSAGTIMGVNLGGFNRTGFESGLLYQHSRKDPFLGYASTGDVQAKSTLEWPTPVASDAQTGTYAYTVQNPTVFITMNNLNSDWFYTGSTSLPNYTYGGLWNNSDGKSQNDPCPPGWRIPKGNTLVSVYDRETVNKYNIWSVAYNSDFTATSYTLAGLFCYDKFGGSKMSNNGDYFFSGYLSEETGVIRQGGVEGYCWAATNLGDYGYNCLQINKDKTVKHLSTAISGARAVSVRCVKK